MRTYYDELGVASTATADELRHAYRTRAKAIHPDAKAHASPSERQRLEQSMRSLNEAWSVLRDPTRRQQYDATLRPPSSVRPMAPAYPSGSYRPSGQPMPVDAIVIDDDRPFPNGGMAVPRWLPRMTAVVALAVALFLFVGTAFLRRATDVIPQAEPDRFSATPTSRLFVPIDTSVRTFPLEPDARTRGGEATSTTEPPDPALGLPEPWAAVIGQCTQPGAFGSIIVDCTASHDGVIAWVTPATDGCESGTQPRISLIEGERVKLCIILTTETPIDEGDLGDDLTGVFESQPD